MGVDLPQLGSGVTVETAEAVELAISDQDRDGELIRLIVRGAHRDAIGTDHLAILDTRVVAVSLKKAKVQPFVVSLRDCYEFDSRKMLGILYRTWDSTLVDIGFLQNTSNDESIFLASINEAIESLPDYNTKLEEQKKLRLPSLGKRFDQSEARQIAQRLNLLLHEGEFLELVVGFKPASGMRGDSLALTNKRILVFDRGQAPADASASLTYQNLESWSNGRSGLSFRDINSATVVLGKLKFEKEDHPLVQRKLDNLIVTEVKIKKKKIPVAEEQTVFEIQPTTPKAQVAPVDRVLTPHGNYDLKLMSEPRNKIAVIKKFKERSGVGLREAKNIVESAPVVLFRNLNETRAEELKDEFESLGAALTLIPLAVPEAVVNAPTTSTTQNSGLLGEGIKGPGIQNIRLDPNFNVIKQAQGSGGLPEQLPDPLPAGFVLGDFGSVIDQPEGAEGAFGRVYRVKRAFDDRTLAGKLYMRGANAAYAEMAGDEIKREVAALEALSHSAIVRVFGPIPVTSKGEWMILSEWIDGGSLSPYTDGSQILQGEQIYRLGEQLLSALEYLESANVVHRDLKPANVMLTALGDAKIIDFNLARESGQMTAIAGTQMYMPPDVFTLDTSVDHFVDRYSAGVILFELICWTHPYMDYFLRNQPIKSGSRPARPSVIREEIPASLNSFLEQAVSPLDNQRFQSASEMRTAWINLQSDISQLTYGSAPPQSVSAPADAAPTPQENLDVNAVNKFCVNCGAKRNTEGRFCINCGQPFSG
jgi:ribosomal protein L7/L12